MVEQFDPSYSLSICFRAVRKHNLPIGKAANLTFLQQADAATCQSTNYILSSLDYNTILIQRQLFGLVSDSSMRSMDNSTSFILMPQQSEMSLQYL